MLTELCAEEKDLVIIGGGVAGYVAAIKAGQEGLKVRKIRPIRSATTIQNSV
jgi:pyruvate/2-oxoglutarate dehydrogenase complex dihydrolipoamide dehydrogenase (E3) component